MLQADRLPEDEGREDGRKDFEQAMTRALFHGAEPRDVRRMEFELLDDGRWRWRIGDADGPIFSAVAEPAEFSAVLAVTEMLMETMSAVVSAAAEEMQPDEEGS